jgi:hypothetical protein
MKLLNDLKKRVVQAAAAVKNAACNLWRSAAALFRRLQQATVDTVTTAQTAVADWWLANRTPLAAFLAVYALALLFAVSSMVYAFYLERNIPAIKSWLDALFNGQLRLPGWELTAARIAAAPQTGTPTPTGMSSAG